MKTLYTLLLLLLFTIGFAQKQKFPDIPFNSDRAEVFDYYKLLNVRNKSAIIITAGELPTYHNRTIEYAVYFKDGSIKLFTEDDNRVITEIIASEGQKAALKAFLFNTNWSEISNYNLYGKHEEDKYTITLDGTTDYINIIKGNKMLLLSSQFSLSSIERKVPGWEDRVKLLELIKTFEDYFKP